MIKKKVQDINFKTICGTIYNTITLHFIGIDFSRNRASSQSLLKNFVQFWK